VQKSKDFQGFKDWLAWRSAVTQTIILIDCKENALEAAFNLPQMIVPFERWE
jgi:hypothetical protein